MSLRTTRSASRLSAQLTNGTGKLVEITEKTTIKPKSNTKVERITKKTTRKIKQAPKSPSKLKREAFETKLASTIIPSDLALPLSFIEAHHPDFIKGINHILLIDPTLYPIIIHEPFRIFSKDAKQLSTLQDYFHNLCSGIIAQQVSGAAAKSIESKVCRLFNEDYLADGNFHYFPTPLQIMEQSNEGLRSAGLSVRKAEYVKVVAENFINGEITHELFVSKSDEEIIEKLVTLKGIGEWSAKMFMMFALRKPDVFAHDDLGVARGCSRYLTARPELLAKIKKDVIIEKKKKSKFESGSKRDWVVYKDEYVSHVGDLFSPHRSILMLIFWRLGSTNIDILENV